MKSDLPQAIRFNPQLFEIGFGCPNVPGYDIFRIFPVRSNLGLANHTASKKDLDLMKTALGVVKLIDQTKSTNLDLQPGFFKDLSCEIVRQGAPRDHATAWCTKQGASPVRPCIHEEQLFLLDDHRPNGDTR